MADLQCFLSPAVIATSTDQCRSVVPTVEVTIKNTGRSAVSIKSVRIQVRCGDGADAFAPVPFKGTAGVPPSRWWLRDASRELAPGTFLAGPNTVPALLGSGQSLTFPLTGVEVATHPGPGAIDVTVDQGASGVVTNTVTAAKWTLPFTAQFSAAPLIIEQPNTPVTLSWSCTPEQATVSLVDPDRGTEDKPPVGSTTVSPSAPTTTYVMRFEHTDADRGRVILCQQVTISLNRVGISAHEFETPLGGSWIRWNDPVTLRWSTHKADGVDVTFGVPRPHSTGNEALALGGPSNVIDLPVTNDVLRSITFAIKDKDSLVVDASAAGGDSNIVIPLGGPITDQLTVTVNARAGNEVKEQWPAVFTIGEAVPNILPDAFKVVPASMGRMATVSWQVDNAAAVSLVHGAPNLYGDMAWVTTPVPPKGEAAVRVGRDFDRPGAVQLVAHGDAVDRTLNAGVIAPRFYRGRLRFPEAILDAGVAPDDAQALRDGAQVVVSSGPVFAQRQTFDVREEQGGWQLVQLAGRITIPIDIGCEFAVLPRPSALSYATSAVNCFTDKSKATPVDLRRLRRSQRAWVEVQVWNMGSRAWGAAGTPQVDIVTTPPERQSMLRPSGPEQWIEGRTPAHVPNTAPQNAASIGFPVEIPPDAAIGAHTEAFMLCSQNEAYFMDSPVMAFPSPQLPTFVNFVVVY
ncbi:MAG TPA: hypothetical protein VFB78_14025 [Acidimicrobiales bacterium]|nr:hypothetical protein [Acidimicrobiales bacterium]